MMKSSPPLHDCPADNLLLILEYLIDDAESLCSLSLTFKLLRYLTLPFLLKRVDLSSHNAGRQPEQEDDLCPEIYADYSDEYRPLSLLRRQRAFLRLIVDRPDLALHVFSFTWTLIWIDFDEDSLQEIDFELWNVFGRLMNVHTLDLASLHQIAEEPFIRKNPSRLFPAATSVRLVGWMHRGLVEAVMNSLDPSRLHALRLNYLQDEGAFADGKPMSEDMTRTYAPHFDDVGFRNGRDCVTEPISGDLYARQREGVACSFPGPMWTPLLCLSNFQCSSLVKFETKIQRVERHADVRNYFKCFDETAKFLSTIRPSLKFLTIVFAECPIIYDEICIGTARNFRVMIRRWHITLAAYFLEKLFSVLGGMAFPNLSDVSFQGFSMLEKSEPNEGPSHILQNVRELIQSCSLAKFTDQSKVDRRPVFLGYDYYPDGDTLEEFKKALEQS
ncbi:MAG: hypothetical protein Q9160_004122 [Pyrenula sp. 1 TL-2023]